MLHGSYGLNAGTTSVNGRPVRWLTAGHLGGLPEVILLPGLGAPGYLAPWARQSAVWTRTTVLDLPGWHYGRARSCPPSLDAIASTTARWLELTGRRGVVLLGHSTGAQTVLRTALLAPERLAGLVLAGPTFAPATRSVRMLLRRAATTLIRETAAELPATVPSYLHSGVLPLLRFLLSALPDRPEDLLPQLRVPLLVLTGERDGFAPPAWARQLARLAAASCVVLPGSHNACFPHPELADAALHQAVLSWQAR
jgi:pimeloyl-ACP methyl ester carboxylesterase